jgi:hypothetical protein
MFRRRWFGDAALSVTVAELATALTQAAETIKQLLSATAESGLDRPRQVVGRIPVVEFLPQRLGDEVTNYEFVCSEYVWCPTAHRRINSGTYLSEHRRGLIFRPG